MIDRMERMPVAVRSLVAHLSPEDCRARGSGGAWSIIEIVNHLADEDADDFRARLRSTLEDPARPWPPTDPEGWAVQREYQERELGESLARFERERAETIRWLRSLNNPDWKKAYMHPRHGPVYAGELMASWPAHDALHIRQIAKRLFELAAREGASEGFGIGYAGAWGT